MAACLLVSLLHIVAPEPLERIERMSVNWRFLARGAEAPSGDVVVVGYDEASTRALGRWPVSRRVIAQAIDRVADDGAKTIAMDYLWLEPELDLPQDIRADLQGLSKTLPAGSDAAKEADALLRAASADATLAQSMRRAGNVLLPFSYSPDSGSRETPNWIFPWHFVRTKPACAQTDAVQFGSGMQAPLPSLTAAAVLGGNVNINFDVDDAPRSEYLATYFDDDCFPSLTLAATAHYLGVDWRQVWVDLGNTVHLGPDSAIAMNSDNSVVVNYFGTARVMPTVSFADVISGRLEPGTFKNKLVLFGTNYQGGTDFVRSPFESELPGVVRNAMMAERLIHGGNLILPHWSFICSLVAVILLGSGSAYVARRLPTGIGVASNVGLVVGWSITAYLVMFPGGVWLNWLYPVLSIIINAGAQRTMRNITDERERRRAEQDLRESEERYALAARVRQ